MDILNYKEETLVLDEGVNDPGIFKAIILAGGPGSGKSYVAGGIFGIPSKVNASAYGLKLVNQDKELTRIILFGRFVLSLATNPTYCAPAPRKPSPESPDPWPLGR